MAEFAPHDPDWEAKTRASFARQSVMGLIGAELAELTPGFCAIRLPWRADLCQQHGFHHAGITTTIADSAAGYAALSLMPPGSAVLTIELKINLMAPAAGPLFLARGRVVRPGRTIVVAQAEVVAIADGAETLIALLTATEMRLPEAEGRPAG